MLSRFSQSILDTLADASEPLTADEIAKRMSADDGRTYSGHHVETYLEHALKEFTHQLSDGRWKRVRQSKNEANEGKRSSEIRDTRAESNEVSQLPSSLEGLDRSILDLLLAEGKRLKANEIARSLSSNLRMVSETAVRARLSGRLSEYVEQDPQYRWYLKEENLEGRRNATFPDDESPSISEGETYTKRILSLIQPVIDSAESPTSVAEIAKEIELREPGISEDEISSVLLNHYPGETYLVSGTGWVFKRDDLNASDMGTNDEVDNQHRSAAPKETDDEQKASPPSGSGREEDLSRPKEEAVRMDDEGEHEEHSSVGSKSPSSPNDSAHEEAGQSSEYQQVVRAVASVLDESDSPLRKHEITNRLKDGGLDVSRDDVTSALYEGKGSFFSLLSDFTWTLADSVMPGDVVVGSRSADTQDASAAQEKDSEITTKGVRHKADGLLSTLDGQPGKAATVGRYLQIADRISLILGLSGEPLSCAELTEYLGSCGYVVSEHDVQRTIDSILSEFVSESPQGYSLGEYNNDKDEAEQDTPEQGTPAIDESTRARLSGSTYEYTFHSEPFESAALFYSQLRGGTVKVIINESHPVYDHLSSLIDGSEDTTRADLQRLSEGVRMLLAAWVDLESNLTGRQSKLAEELRADWGRAIRLLLRS
jgi:hypothetical protein